MPGQGPPFVVKLLAEQRKRCLATILSTAENSAWWPALSNTQQSAFREQVRSAINVFYDFTRDVIKVSEEDGPRSDVVLDLIRSMHREQREIAAHIIKGV